MFETKIKKFEGIENKFLMSKDKSGYWVQCSICRISTYCSSRIEANELMQGHTKDIALGYHEYWNQVLTTTTPC